MAIAPLGELICFRPLAGKWFESERARQRLGFNDMTAVSVPLRGSGLKASPGAGHTQGGVSFRPLAGKWFERAQ